MPVYGEDVRIYIKAININGYPVKGANVEITISSGHTENGKLIMMVDIYYPLLVIGR